VSSRAVRGVVEWGCISHDLQAGGGQVGDAGGVEGADQEGSAVGGEGEDVGDHAAVREDTGWFAGGVDEALVEAAVVVQLVDQGNETGAGQCVPLAEFGDRCDHLPAALRHLERPVLDRCQPHLLLPDQPVQQVPDRDVVVDPFHRQLDRPVERRRIQPRAPLDQLAGQPHVMLDHPDQYVHPSHLSSCRQP
jgi:hypothetical protein